jgi:hypothetical protein
VVPQRKHAHEHHRVRDRDGQAADDERHGYDVPAVHIREREADEAAHLCVPRVREVYMRDRRGGVTHRRR